MFYTFRSDIRRAVISKGLLIGALSMATVTVLSCFDKVFPVFSKGAYLPNGYHTQIVLDALHSEMVMFVVPIISALPFTPAFMDDIRSGFIKQFLPRSGIKSYIWSKLAACAISGGSVLVLGVLLAYGLASAVMMPLETAPGGGMSQTLPLTLLSVEVARYFLSGALWSLSGFTLTSITKSRYMAFASPFVLYYLLVIFYERYFNTLYWLYPIEWLNPTHYWILGDWGLILLLLILAAAIGTGFTLYARRNLRHG